MEEDFEHYKKLVEENLIFEYIGDYSENDFETITMDNKSG